MNPIIKWPGGKTKEIEIIKNHMPKKIDRYVEPFLGGGSVFFNLQNKKNIINDISNDLTTFYNMIKDGSVDMIVKKISFFDKMRKDIADIEDIGLDNIDILNKKYSNFYSHNKFPFFLNRELQSKLKTKNNIERKNGNALSDENKRDLIKTAINASIYYCLRNDFNDSTLSQEEHIFSWFIMRELSYSSMFRYSKNGEFNVPYGGMSYNSKSFSEKISRINQAKNSDFFINTDINNMDFVKLFEKYDYFNENDFIFLDPPYDSEFSKYNADSDFSKNDQVKLRDCLLKTPANIMVVIKNTDFIQQLYSESFNIKAFDKKYNVNMRNRNEKNVTHLLITNY